MRAAGRSEPGNKTPLEAIMRLSVSSAAEASINGAMQKEPKMSNAIQFDRDLAGQFRTDSVDRLIARRNMQVGLWAGARLALPEESRAVYALEVMLAGMIDSGHDDVVDKIMGDFARQGVAITREEILVQLSRSHRVVTAKRGLPN
jgi:hypothetical protein